MIFDLMIQNFWFIGLSTLASDPGEQKREHRTGPSSQLRWGHDTDVHSKTALASPVQASYLLGESQTLSSRFKVQAENPKPKSRQKPKRKGQAEAIVEQKGLTK